MFSGWPHYALFLLSRQEKIVRKKLKMLKSDKKGVKILQFKLDKKKEYKIEEDKEEEEI